MRKALALIIKAAVSGLLLYFALAAVDIGAVKARLGQIDAAWVALGLLVLVVQLAVIAVRWQQIVIRCGSSLQVGRAFRISMIAGFFNQTLPSSVGGDAVRIWLLAQACRLAHGRLFGAARPHHRCRRAGLSGRRLPAMDARAHQQSHRTRRLVAHRIWRHRRGTGFHRLGVGALTHPATLVADASPGGHGQGRYHVAAHAARVRADLRALHHHSPADGAGGLVRRPLGGHQSVAALLAVPGAAGRAGHRRADFDRRLGRARKRDGRGVRLCRSGAKRRTDRVAAVRRRLPGARHRRRPGLDHHRRAERARVRGDDRRDTSRRSARCRPRSASPA